MKKILILNMLFLFISQIFAKDYVHPSEYMDGDDSSFSLFPILVVIGIVYVFYQVSVDIKKAGVKITNFDKFIVYINIISILFLLGVFWEVSNPYYNFLRYIIPISAILNLIYSFYEKNIYKYYFIIIILLFNPLYPIPLENIVVWRIINIIFAGMFITNISFIKEKSEIED